MYAGKRKQRFSSRADQGTCTAEHAKSFPAKALQTSPSADSRAATASFFQELHSPVAEALCRLGQQIIVRRILDEKKDELQMIKLKAAVPPHFF